jgi:hypothetical protein
MNTAGITGKRAIPSDNSVAGNNHGNGIVVISHSDRAGGSGSSNRPGDFAIGPGFPIGNPEQFGPDGFLERGTLDIKLQVELSSLPLEVFRKLLNGLMMNRRIGNGTRREIVAKVN